MRVNPFLVPIIVIAALLGSSLIAQAGGFWSTSGRTSVNLENLTAVDLKGWMTLQQVMDGMKVSKEQLYAAGNIPLDIPTSTALKDLEGIVPDFEVSTLREKLGAPEGYVPEEMMSGDHEMEPMAEPTPTPVPQPTATPIVHTQPITGTHAGPGDGTGVGPTPLPAGQILPADQIKGRMTLREVADQCAVPLDQLLAALNLPSDTDANTALKDLINSGTLADVDPVRVAVAKLQQK
jgi:hypothetical protein